MSKYIPRRMVNGKVYIEKQNEVKKAFHESRRNAFENAKRGIIIESLPIPNFNKYSPKD